MVSKVLITGGTGSFGKTMLMRLLTRQDVEEIRIFSRDEEKQDALRRRVHDDRVKYYIGDVRDYDSALVAAKGVDYVFHAAALKQVPSCEFFPMEAVRTNVFGSWNIVRAGINAGVRSVVALSTDKAVFPINSMGMTKGLMEKVIQSQARELKSSDTTLCCVRYGNVMYSRGSVIPLFVEQIKAGKQLTITNPEMTRFLMPLAQAVELVEFAFNNCSDGDIFIRKAPASTIATLADAICDLFGVERNSHVIGTRHGEKVYETLASADELRRADDLGDYYRVRMDDRDLDYGKFYSEGEPKTSELEEYHSHNAERLDIEGVKRLLLTVPEFATELEAWRGR